MSRSDQEDHGLVHVASRYSVPETIERLEPLAQSRGLTIFARIDFSGDAQKVGLTIRPAQLLIFGNPKAGTPLMIASPSIAIDLPLKALAGEDGNGKVWLSYNKAEYLMARHGIPKELLKHISAIGALVEEAVK
jgi:uncharacterized protein (DUF302 family)